MADRTVVYRFEGKVDGLKAQLASAGTSVKNFGSELTALDAKGERMRAGLTTVGSAATKTGLVVAGGLALAGKAAMDWEVAWTGVLKTVDGTPAQLSKLETGLRNLAKETGFAHGEVAAVAEAAGQLGISTGGIESFTKTMLDMGVSTNLSAEEAATGLARFRNIMGITEAEIQNTGSAMVELGNNFATTEGEILAMSLRIAGAGRQAGLSTSDVLGLSAAMSSVGIEAEAGGTAVSMTMKRIGKEVETSGESLGLFARVAGMSSAEFQQAWGQDAAGTLQKFVAGLNDTERVGMSTNAVLRELGINGIREADSLLRLSGNAEGLAAALETANEGFVKNVALTEESGKFYATTSQQMKQAWAEIKDAAIDAGESMLPVITAIADAVSVMAGAWQSLPDGVQTAIVGFAAFVAIAGLSIGAVARVANSIAGAKLAMQQLGVSTGGASASIRTLRADLATLAATSMTAGARTQREMDRSAASAARLRTTLGRIGRVAAPLAAIGIATTGVADDIGLANTASMALMGTMVAPGWGTAAGAVVGYMMDVAGANNAVEKSMAEANKAMAEATGFAEMEKALDSARVAMENYRRESEVTGVDLLNPLKTVPGMKNLLTDDLGKKSDEYRELATASYEAQRNARDLAVALGEVGATEAIPLANGEVWEQAAFSMEQLDAAARAAGPAIESLGLDKAFADLNGNEIARVADEIKRLDSESGRVEQLGEAFSGLESGMTSTADAAKALGDALDGLLGPAMDQERAMLAWKESLGALKGDLAENSRSLDSNSEAGRQNRSVILDRIDALNETVVADAGAGASQEQLSRKMRNGRKAILDSADAAGLNRGAVKEMVDQMGLTPKMIRTLIKLDGAEKAKADVAALKGYLDSIPAWKSTTIRVGWSVATNPLAAMMNPSRLMGNADGGTIGRYDIGGTVAGQRSPYGDKVLAYLAPGEEVISNRYGQADRHRDLLKAINGNRFADGTNGALAASVGVTTSGLNIARELRFVGMGLKELRKELKASTKSIDGLKDVRSGLRADRDALVSSLQSNYRSSLTGEAGGAFTGVNTSPLATLNADIANLQALNKVRTTLSKKGLKRDALDAVLQEMSLGDLTAMSGWSDAEVKKMNRRYNQREALLSGKNSVPAAIGRDLYGSDLNDLNKAIRSGNQTQNRIEKRLAQIQKNTKDAPKNTAKANAAASKRGVKRDRRNRR